MSVDWWARGLGISGIVLGAGGIAWRWFEWWATGRSRMKVIASAGSIQETGIGLVRVRGEGFGVNSITIEAINTCRRAITIDAVGFIDPQTRSEYMVGPQPGQLPATLDPGQRVTIRGDPEHFLEVLRPGARLVPFCRDVEGKVHKGKQDQHLRKFIRRAKEASDA